MKNHLFQFTLVAAFIFTLLVPPQQLSSQVFCPTVGGPNAIRQIGSQFAPGELSNHTGPYYLKIYVHVITKFDKTGGYSEEEVQQALAFLNEAFNTPHGIFFVWDCNIDTINNDSHYFADKCTDTGYPAIFNVNSNPDGIDIYLFSENTDPQSGCGSPPIPPCGCGLAADVPSSALYVAGNYWDNTFGALALSHVLSHEMGHALGLFHTHHGTFVEGTIPQCAELIDGSNCSSCGDYVCDTPADPNINFDVNPNNCQWLNGGQSPYSPNERNIMAYSHPSCMTSFTEKQGERMRQIYCLSPCATGLSYHS
jgi:hypothetical protein